MRTLLAAMQRRVAFRTVTVPVDPVRQLRGTTETAGRGHCLHQARQARTGDVERWLRARGPGPLVAAAAVSEIGAVRVHVTLLSILSIAVHGELGTPKNRRRDKSKNQGVPWFVAHCRSITRSAVRRVQATAVDTGYGRVCGKAERPAKTALSENLTERPLLRNFLHPPNREELDVGHRHPLGPGMKRRQAGWSERDAPEVRLRLNWAGHGERLDEGVGIPGVSGV